MCEALLSGYVRYLHLQGNPDHGMMQADWAIGWLCVGLYLSNRCQESQRSRHDSPGLLPKQIVTSHIWNIQESSGTNTQMLQ
jgi:hypothetical protein